MKSNVIKRLGIVFFFGIILLVMSYIAFKGYHVSEYEEVAKIKITEITDTMEDIFDDTAGPVVTREISFDGILLNTAKKGESISGMQQLTFAANSITAKAVEKGDVIYATDVNNPGTYLFISYDRLGIVLFLVLVFVATMLIFGGSKGLLALTGLGYALASILLCLIPALLSEQNIAAWGVIIAIYIIVETILIVNGFSKKSLASILGCLAGVVVISLISLISIHFGFLTGAVDDTATYFKFDYLGSNFLHVIFVVFLIGAIGAIMDVAVELAASLWELRQKAKDHSPKSLIKSGFNIGKDMIGTMTNTLALAFLSSSFVSIAYFISYNYNLDYLFSSEGIAAEIIQIIIGSLGILLTIPATTIICAFIYNLSNKKRLKK